MQDIPKRSVLTYGHPSVHVSFVDEEHFPHCSTKYAWQIFVIIRLHADKSPKQSRSVESITIKPMLTLPTLIQSD